jgi:hypothetical protein
MILSETDARAINNKILALSKADSCTVSLSGGEGRHLRFAQNMATTSGAPSSLGLSVESHFGKRSGSANGTDLTDAGLAALVTASEETARLAPENPEFVPPLGPQKYGAGTAFADATRDATSDQLALAIQPVPPRLKACRLRATWKSAPVFPPLAQATGSSSTTARPTSCRRSRRARRTEPARAGPARPMSISRNSTPPAWVRWPSTRRSVRKSRPHWPPASTR